MMWKRAIDPIMMLEDPTEHRWKEDLQPNWGEEPYPDDMEELLLHNDPANSDDNEYDESEDSDIEILISSDKTRPLLKLRCFVIFRVNT